MNAQAIFAAQDGKFRPDVVQVGQRISLCHSVMVILVLHFSSSQHTGKAFNILMQKRCFALLIIVQKFSDDQHKILTPNLPGCFNNGFKLVPLVFDGNGIADHRL